MIDLMDKEWWNMGINIILETSKMEQCREMVSGKIKKEINMLEIGEIIKRMGMEFIQQSKAIFKVIIWHI